MTRASRTALLLLTVGMAACRGDITMRLALDRGGVPMALRLRAVEGFSHVDIDRLPPAHAYTVFQAGAPLDPRDAVDYPLDSRLTGRNCHLRAVYLDANGLALYEGEGDATIADGATLTVILSPTGPQ
jgi:hypothetical protein